MTTHIVNQGRQYRFDGAILQVKTASGWKHLRPTDIGRQLYNELTGKQHRSILGAI